MANFISIIIFILPLSPINGLCWRKPKVAYYLLKFSVN